MTKQTPEFDPEHFGHGLMERWDKEHPEQAYRRGVQHGAHFVVEALRAAGGVDAALVRRLRDYVGLTLYNWRYARRNRLRRRLDRDAPPLLDRRRTER